MNGARVTGNVNVSSQFYYPFKYVECFGLLSENGDYTKQYAL